MPWPRLLEVAEEAGAGWYIAEQDNPRVAMEDVEISLRAMRQLSAG
jgi:hypothetical protein